nr:hypothetical protein Iba_chr14bCG17470 [Ipomoea batatas]GMD90308.1 hypothetical protein Iba_chr14dCG8420 [Ipomoea batatas]GME06312.1 hypothetical protein Iba_scaffold3997CG0130 [Ipomoea batatas]
MARYYVVADDGSAGSSFGLMVMFWTVVMSAIIIIPMLIFGCGDCDDVDDGNAAGHSGGAGAISATAGSASIVGGGGGGGC